jgi:hypothetical protein
MLTLLMMLPLPRAAIFGASAATRRYGHIPDGTQLNCAGLLTH